MDGADSSPVSKGESINPLIIYVGLPTSENRESVVFLLVRKGKTDPDM